MFASLFFSQATMTTTPKATKNGKPGYDDTTLPLMEKSQGQLEGVCLTVAVFACLEDQVGGIKEKRSQGSSVE